MDAVKFIEEARRRYKVEGKAAGVLSIWFDPEIIVKEVEEWSAANPLKTRQTEILKMFPNADIDREGVLDICPRLVNLTYICPRSKGEGCLRKCPGCRKQYWSGEIE